MSKTIVITGATDGLGLGAARYFIQQGHTLLLVGRNEAKLDTVKSAFSAAQQAHIYCYCADLSSVKQTRELGLQLLSLHPTIDVLINNAGGVFSSFKLTEERLERTIALNHFSYVVLTSVLLPALKASKAARIINVSSNSHYSGKINLASFTQNKGYNLLKAYEQSKLANMLYTYALAARLKADGITVNALSPKRVATAAGKKGTAWWTKLIWQLLVLYKSVPLEEAVATYAYLAESDEVATTSGAYFESCKPKIPSRLATDHVLAQQLWDYTEQMLDALV